MQGDDNYEAVEFIPVLKTNFIMKVSLQKELCKTLIDMASNKLIDIITSAAKIAGVKVKCKPKLARNKVAKIKPKSKPWFDTKCTSLKQHCSKLFALKTSNADMVLAESLSFDKSTSASTENPANSIIDMVS